MAKKIVRQHNRLLHKARRILGLPHNAKKRVVFEAVAKHYSQGPPSTHQAGWNLLIGLCRSVSAPKVPPKPKPAQTGDVNTIEFLESYEWRRLRMQVLVKRGARCECCGATPKDGVQIHVDHVKPRRLFPALALDENNLQVLCGVCNHGKGNWDQTDWRIETPQPEPAPVPVAQPADPMRPRLVKRA